MSDFYVLEEYGDDESGTGFDELSLRPNEVPGDRTEERRCKPVHVG